MLFTLLILVTAFLLNLFLPWWSIIIPGLFFGYSFRKKAMPSFGWGFLALFILWGGQAAYIHIQNDGILSSRIAEMLGVGSPLIVIAATAIIGGFVSGLATLTGSLANQKTREFSRT
jgi:hypothetical protein